MNSSAIVTINAFAVNELKG